MKVVQNWTVFAISTPFFKNEGVRTQLYFHERGDSFKEGWESMF